MARIPSTNSLPRPSSSLKAAATAPAAAHSAMTVMTTMPMRAMSVSDHGDKGPARGRHRSEQERGRPPRERVGRGQLAFFLSRQAADEVTQGGITLELRDRGDA